MSKSEKISFTYNQAIDLVTKELENTKIGQEAGTKITGERNIILGKDAAYNCLDINDSIISGYRVGFNLTNSSSNLVYVVNKGLEQINKDHNTTIIGSKLFKNVMESKNNLITGFNQFNSIESNVQHNITYGSEIGNNLLNSKNNIVIGIDNLSNVTIANSNLFIGNYNTSLDNINNNIITLGNFNNLQNNPFVIGNNNTITTKETKVIGNNLTSVNKLIAFNHLKYYDDVLNNNIINSLQLSNLIVYPIDNYIFKSPYNPIELSLNNNLNLKTLNFTLDTFTNIKEPNDILYNVTYNLTDNVNDIYRFSEPTILYFDFNTNYINLQYDNIDDNLNYYILITEVPKYSFVEKLLYNLDETIVLVPYKEYNHIKDDNFKVNFIINYKDISYQARYQFNINVVRNVVDTVFTPTTFYSPLIAFEWFNKPLNITKLKADIEVNNQIVIYQNSVISSDFKVYGDTINIDNNPIDIININDIYDININTVWYLFSNNLFYISTDVINGFIYIERPPKNNIITNNLFRINNNIVNFDYFLNSDKSDTITIRIINLEKTKISKSFNILIKNYIVNNDTLTLDLINDNYYIDNGVINNPVNSPILPLVNSCNIFKIYEEYNYPKQINNNINNNITLDIYPFNKVDIYSRLIDIGFKDINESNIYILNNSRLSNGYIKNNNYINYRNVNDSLTILIAINRLNFNIANVYNININVINNYEIRYYTQYIYNNVELLKTLTVVNHPKNKIQIYKDFKLTFLHLQEIIEGFNNFKIIFGDNVVNINLDIYPTINDFVVLYNQYFFKQLFSIIEINKEHKIEYIFNNIENFKISFNVFITLLFNIKYYNFRVILNNSIILTYDETSSLEYNKLNTILIDDRYVKTLNSFQIVYSLSNNIINNNDDLVNYFLEITFSDLRVEYNINLGNNVLYGRDIECIGYDNIGLGSLYNLYGNSSIVIGNRIGNNFINNSIIVGNNNLKDVIPRNVIMIGNNNYNNIIDNLNFDKVAQNNPIFIGHNLQFKRDVITNINNIIVEKDDKVIINGKKIVIGNKFNTLVYPSSLTIDKYHSEREISYNSVDNLTNFNVDLINYSETMNCRSGLLAPNGNIYFIPNVNYSKIIYYDGLSVNDIQLSENGLYSSGVLGPNGKIYLVPFLANHIGVLDIKTNVISRIEIYKLNVEKYISGILAQNGKIYFIPYGVNNIGELDIITNSFKIIDIEYVKGFNSGILVPNGKIYMIGNDMGVFDIITHELNIIKDISGESILYLPTGGIFVNNKLVGTSFNPLTMENKVYDNLGFEGGINLGVNGRIYGIENSELIELLITHNKKIKYQLGYNVKSNKMVLGLNNKLYTIPDNDDKIYIINLDIDNIVEYNVEGDIPDNWISLLTPYFNHN